MGAFVGLVFICLGLVSSSVSADECVQKGPCTCEFYNGTGFDLRPIAKDTFFTAQIFQDKNNGTEREMSTYYYHPCIDLMLKLNANNVNNTCREPLAVSCVFTFKLFMLIVCNRKLRFTSYILLFYLYLYWLCKHSSFPKYKFLKIT